MGTADRIIRTTVAVVVAVLYFTNVISTGTLFIVLAVIAGIFLVTSAVSFCPLYAIFGIKTCKTEAA